MVVLCNGFRCVDWRMVWYNGKRVGRLALFWAWFWHATNYGAEWRVILIDGATDFQGWWRCVGYKGGVWMRRRLCTCTYVVVVGVNGCAAICMLSRFDDIIVRAVVCHDGSIIGRVWKWLLSEVGTGVPMMEILGVWVPTIRRWVGWDSSSRCADIDWTIWIGFHRGFLILVSTSHTCPCQTVTGVSLKDNCATGCSLELKVAFLLRNNIFPDVKVTLSDDAKIQWLVVMYLRWVVGLSCTPFLWAVVSAGWVDPFYGCFPVQCIIPFVSGFSGVQFRLTVFQMYGISHRLLFSICFP